MMPARERLRPDVADCLGPGSLIIRLRIAVYFGSGAAATSVSHPLLLHHILLVAGQVGGFGQAAAAGGAIITAAAFAERVEPHASENEGCAQRIGERERLPQDRNGQSDGDDWRDGRNHRHDLRRGPRQTGVDAQRRQHGCEDRAAGRQP